MRRSVSNDTELKRLSGHTCYVPSVAFSGDGTRIVSDPLHFPMMVPVSSSSENNSVRVWNASTGVELKTLISHTSYVLSAHMTPASSLASDRSVRV
jgi:WD40 repeat protein